MLRYACLNVLDIHESIEYLLQFQIHIFKVLASISESYEFIKRNYASIPNSYENILKFSHIYDIIYDKNS